MMKIELIKYRDAGLPTYTWFWVSENRRVISPYFDTQEDALSWEGLKDNEIVVIPSK